MNKKCLVLISALLSVSLMGCSGMRQANGAFSTHAESIRILGFQIPENDQKEAMSLVPKGAKIESIQSTPADWNSVVGVLSNILWIGCTEVSGTTGSK